MAPLFGVVAPAPAPTSLSCGLAILRFGLSVFTSVLAPAPAEPVLASDLTSALVSVLPLTVESLFWILVFASTSVVSAAMALNDTAARPQARNERSLRMQMSPGVEEKVCPHLRDATAQQCPCHSP